MSNLEENSKIVVIQNLNIIIKNICFNINVTIKNFSLNLLVT